MNSFRSLLFIARRFKKETTLNFMGLVVSFAVFYLMMTQIDYNINYNRCIPEGERVFRVETTFGIYSNRVLNSLIAKMPQVEATTELACLVNYGIFRAGYNREEHLCLLTNLTPFGAINARCLDGELEWDDYGEKSLIIPASLSRKLFDGRTDVAGQPLLYGEEAFTVRGVYEDYPDNCSLKNFVYISSTYFIDSWDEWSYILYLKLKADENPEDFQHDFAKLLKPIVWEAEWNDALSSGEIQPVQEDEMREQFESLFANFDLKVRPVHETWFSGVHSQDKGNPAMLFVLQLACLLVIIISTVNFLNFTLAASPVRIKGINIRRVLGEEVWKLRLGLLAETVAVSLAALSVAMVLCLIVAQQQFLHVWSVVLMVVLAVFVGFIAGAYPAFFATSFEPALSLKGSFGLTPKGRHLRKLLLFVQLTIDMFVVIFIGVLFIQVFYIYRSDYGFDKDEVLCAQLNETMTTNKESLRNDLLQMDGVVDVSYSRYALGTQDIYVSWSQHDDERDTMLVFVCLYVDNNYLRTMGIDVVEGRDFNEHETNCFIINETARRQWPWFVLGTNLSEDSFPVVGVCENVRYASVRKDRLQEPLAFVVLDEAYEGWDDQLGVVNVRITKDADKAIVRKKISDFLNSKSNNHDIEVSFLDDRLEQLYKDEFHFIRQMEWLAVICLLITIVGIFCISMFETEYRRKEIAIRKVMGASTAQILLLLCRRYVWLVIASFIVASPLAYAVGNLWLNTFAEHTSISWWLFPLSFFGVGSITFATIVVEGWRLANEKPTNSISNE